MKYNLSLKKLSRSLCLISALGVSIGSADAQSASIAKGGPIGRRSVADDKWQKEGIYGGFTPADEVLEKRTENRKLFVKDGKTTAQIGAPMHYLDGSGAWQDISLNIAASQKLGYSYANETQKLKSYFPATAGNGNVAINLGNGVEFNWWNNPEMKLTVNGSVVRKYNASQQPGSINKDKIVYNNVYPQVSEEFVVLNGGVENNTIINQLTADMNSLPANGMVELSQFIELPAGAQILINQKEVKTSDFEANYFNLFLKGFDNMLAFSPIVIFDNDINRDEALMLINLPGEKLTAQQKAVLSNHIYQSKYYVHFENNGITITTKLPVSWLKAAGRNFPVTVDPTVVIGATPPGSGNFYGPMTHWYGYQRHADLFLQSEIGGYGNITAIEYYKTSSGSAGNKPTKVFMRTTTATTLTGTAAWNSTTYTGGLTANLDANTDQGTGLGWQMLTMTTPFNYNTNNLLIMVYDAFGGGGSVSYYTSNGTASRQAYKRQDNTDPGDASTTLVESYLPTIRITYSNPTCTAAPSAGAATTTTPTFSCSGAPQLNATGISSSSNITYQWETSLTGQNSWTDVGGPLTVSPAFTAPVIATSRDYRLKTTCPSFGTATSALVTITVNTAVATGTATTSTSSFNCTGSAKLNATGVTIGNGMQYQWQSSPAGLGTWSPVGTAGTSPAFIAPAITTNTDYRLVSTCGPAFTSNVSSSVPVTVQSINITPATSTICATNSQTLQVTLPGPITLYKQDFEGSISDLTFTNTSTGTTANANFIVRPDGWVQAGTGGPFTFTPGSSFIFTNADQLGSGGAINTSMTTPVINTAGATSLSLSFKHYFKYLNPTSGKVEVYNGTSWVQIVDFNSADQGSLTNFATATYDITAHANANMRIRFSFVGGWVWWWALDDIIVQGTLPNLVSWTATTGGGLPTGSSTPSAGNSNISVTPTAGAGTYTYTATSNICGTKTATVTVVPAPAATIAAGSPICDGQTATLNFTGVANNIVYFHQGSSTTVLSTTINGSGTATYTTAALTGNTVFTIDSIKNTTCTVLSSLTATQVVNPRPHATFSGTSTVCQDQQGYISYNATSGGPTVYITYSDGTNTYLDTATSNSQNIEAPAVAPGTYVYNITGLTSANGCAAVSGDYSGTSTVTVKARPDVVITSDDPAVCAGDATFVNFTFSGDAPFVFNYYDGMTTGVSGTSATNTFSFPVNVSSPTTYYVQYLQDANPCYANPGVQLLDSATVTILDTAAITVQPQTTISACSENAAVISMTATGVNLTYTWYENNTAIPTGDPNYVINNNTLTINNVTGLSGNTYYVDVQGQCGNVQTSTITTLTENLGNNWSGTVSSDWNNGMNWSCGTVPIATSNVVIPAGAPNMPAVNITGAQCNNLTIDATASVTFAATNNQLSVHGNILNSGILNGTNGTVVLAGAAQSISGPVVFDNLDVNGGGLKTLGGDVIVNGILDLNSGMIELGANNMYLSQPEAQLGGNPTSYIITNGTGAVVGAGMGAVGGNADSVTFHVGINSTSYTPVALENLGDADSFSVRVIENVYTIGNDVTSPLVTNPVVTRTWMVSENTAGGSIVNMTPMWNSPADPTVDFNPAHVFVAHYWNNEWISYVDSANGAPAAVAGPFAGMWQTTQDSIENFSPFTVASAGQFPLSIRLNSITATNAGARNKVLWSSSKEDKDDMYELESSADGKKFTKIATVAAKGTPSTYTQWDEQPVQGVNYYRVKLLNNDGTSSYSKIVTATVKGSEGFNIEAYPNPVSSTVGVKVNGVVTGNATVIVTDVTGKVVKEKVQVVDNNATINVSNLASGIYMINYSDDVRNESIKITKQ